MDGQTSAQVRYADMNIQHDASMYAALDDMIRLRQEKDTKGFDAAAKDMFIKERMIQIMFNL